MIEKHGILMLCSKLLTNEDGRPSAEREWLTYYMPFVGCSTYMELEGLPVQLTEVVEWISDNYEIDPLQLQKLSHYIQDGKVPSFNGFEVIPR
jgi:hypothetical protein